MRILLDHCVDWRLSRCLPAHEIRSAQQIGWEQLKNGQLLAQAATAAFDVVVTVDQNMRDQLNAAALPAAVVVLVAKSTRLADLILLVPAFEQAIAALQPRTLVEVAAAP